MHIIKEESKTYDQTINSVDAIFSKAVDTELESIVSNNIEL